MNFLPCVGRVQGVRNVMTVLVGTKELHVKDKIVVHEESLK